MWYLSLPVPNCPAFVPWTAALHPGVATFQPGEGSLECHPAAAGAAIVSGVDTSSPTL